MQRLHTEKVNFTLVLGASIVCTEFADVIFFFLRFDWSKADRGTRPGSVVDRTAS